jgi:hypothetical protein
LLQIFTWCLVADEENGNEHIWTSPTAIIGIMEMGTDTTHPTWLSMPTDSLFVDVRAGNKMYKIERACQIRSMRAHIEIDLVSWVGESGMSL